MTDERQDKIVQLGGPIHGDVWRSPVACRNFTVLHVCGFCGRPMVTGHWWRSGSLDPNLHDSIPLGRFMSSMTLVEREAFDA